MRTLPRELLHQAGRAAAIYLLVALLGAGAAIVQALIVPLHQTEPADADSDEPATTGEPSAVGVRWINPR
ncbi:hypothetical protein MOX02_45210 [Methylobacterium oxalidis]|uniref:Uncharacterized protein n=1 Tax=Methylobacterium oxalidis TaxID=944322 RepID=A0A512J971_9HYPH|nr:hypothetical protein MOX02_45210 [Methylobacterium oxalidis]GLS65523.1 hypothetical protein GCM10007888_39050 [Methylobacterium oxalidis]